MECFLNFICIRFSFIRISSLPSSPFSIKFHQNLFSHNRFFPNPKRSNDTVEARNKVKNEDVEIVDVDIISAGLRVSSVPAVNGERNSVPAVNVVRERVNAVIAKRLNRVNRVSDVNGERERVDAVNDVTERVDGVNDVRERVSGVRVNANLGKRKRVKRVESVPAVNGDRERVPAGNSERKRVKRVPAVNGDRERVPAGNSERKRVNRVPAVNDDSAGDCCWLSNVTKAVQRLKVKQTLHIPSWVVQKRLRNRTGIKIRSVVNNRMYDCTIKNPGRGEFERYITHGWYDFLSDHKPKVGQLIQFEVKSPELMVVNIIRCGRHSK